MVYIVVINLAKPKKISITAEGSKLLHLSSGRLFFYPFNNLLMLLVSHEFFTPSPSPPWFFFHPLAKWFQATNASLSFFPRPVCEPTLLIMINHVSEIKAINLLVVTTTSGGNNTPYMWLFSTERRMLFSISSTANRFSWLMHVFRPPSAKNFLLNNC